MKTYKTAEGFFFNVSDIGIGVTPKEYTMLNNIRDRTIKKYDYQIDRITGKIQSYCETDYDGCMGCPYKSFCVDVISNFYQRYQADEYKKLKEDFGEIIDMKPLARGKSGRIWKLQIVGTKKTFTIGKELEIRRALSESHLFSSAFVVDKVYGADKNIPSRFILTGAGWGHGVGMCQIGAAVMGEKGYSYDEILLHYYSDAEIKKIYK